jgi:hypothetical protein
MAPAAVPTGAWLVVGLLLGPYGAGVLSAEVTAHLDAAVSVALGTLGVFIGLAVVPRAAGAMRLLAAAIVESSLTAALVGGAIGALILRWGLPIANPLAAALTMGAAAAASSAGAADEGRSVDAMRIADLDDLLPIVIAAAVCGFAAQPPVGAAAGLFLSIGLGLAMGAVGWMLFERTPEDAERGVFVIGVLALVGGAAAYAGVSPLAAGVAAGLLWRRAPGRADAIVSADLRRIHHPLVVLLMVVAGAQVRVTPAAMFLFAPFVVFRLSGKVLGGFAASRLAPVSGSMLGAHLVSPGVMAIAIAINVQQVAPTANAALLSAVCAGTLAFELIAAFVAPREELA